MEQFSKKFRLYTNGATHRKKICSSSFIIHEEKSPDTIESILTNRHRLHGSKQLQGSNDFRSVSLHELRTSKVTFSEKISFQNLALENSKENHANTTQRTKPEVPLWKL